MTIYLDLPLFELLPYRSNSGQVAPNQIIRGKCVEHEVDAIARKNGKTYVVEIKHHFEYHTLTGLDVGRIIRALFEDVKEGFDQGFNDLRIDKMMAVCNTKYSEHAKRYGECRGINHIGWGYPTDHSLQMMIEEKKFYPLTYLEGVTHTMTERLVSAGIISLKELAEKESEDLLRKTRIPKRELDPIIKKAKTVLQSK